MQLGTHRRPTSRLVTRILLLLALALASFTITQCRMVGDRLNGVGAGLFRRSDCIPKCNFTYQAAKQAEQDLHVRNVQNCNGDAACQAEEEIRHDAAVASIDAAKLACQNACHSQGGGGSGN